MRRLRRLLLILLPLVLVLGTGAVYLVRLSFPVTQGEVRLPGLGAAVEVIRDLDGVPHIYAQSTQDLFMAQGYVHAQDRFWQMDFWRHTGAGRLSELFGESQVDTDKFLRALGFTALAEQEVQLLDPAALQVLQWYADGVNAYLAGKSGPQISLEYAILGLQNGDYRIEPWTPVHTLTWAKMMSWDLSGNMDEEIERAVLTATLPRERVEQLYPPYPERHPVIVPSDQAPVTETAAPAPPPEALPVIASLGPALDAVYALTGGGFEGIGSNNWAIGGSHTVSGLPILANDPHLGIQMPSIWYEIGLHCTGCPLEVVGFGFPGTPGVVIGHNDRIAWAVTNQSTDTQDLYVEKTHPDDPRLYLVDGEWVEMERRTETIQVAGAEPVTYEVLSTRHGPVITGLYLEEDDLAGSAVDPGDGYVVALAWQTLQPATIVEAILALNQARGYDDFRAAAARWDIAAQSLIYADVEGNIAHQATGEIPVRRAGDGRYPAPGWDSAYDWVGLVPFDDLPGLFNPPRGYVATANQQVVRPGDTPYFGADAAYGYRAARIEQLLTQGGDHDVATSQQIQMDGADGGAANLAPYLSAVASDDPRVVEIRDLISVWAEAGAQVSGDSAGAAAYQAVWRHLLIATFHDELPEDHLPQGGSRWFEVVRNLLQTSDDAWWDDAATAEVETRDQILVQAMASAHDELTELMGAPARWSWGRLHVAVFQNQSFGQSGIAPIEWLFNRTAPPRVGGAESVVNAVGWDPSTSYLVDWVPSMRMVIDLADLSRSTAIHTTGQSGHAFHHHYADMLEMWTDGGQHPMRWTREQVLAEAEATLLLLP